MTEKIMNGLLIFAAKLSSQRHLQAIRNGFSELLPVVVTGAFCTLISNVVCNVRPGYISLANLPGMSWLGSLNPVFTAANYGTMSFITIGIVILIALGLGESYGIKDFALAPVALGSYISLCLTSVTLDCEAAEGGLHEIANVLSANFTDAKGLFVGLITALCATELYCHLVKSGRLEIKLPEGVPSNVARSFTVLFPSCITILTVSLVGFVFNKLTGMTIFVAITTFIQTPLMNILTGLPGYLFLIFMTTVLWTFGIHGTQTLSAIYSPILLAAYAENEAAYAAGTTVPNIICSPFLSCFSIITGAGITGGLLIAILLFSKRDDYRAIAKIAIPCAIFNINEPVTFGLPIVLNPLLAIPFMIAPAASATFAYFMTSIGFCGKMVVNSPWTTPPVLMGFLSSGGSIGAAITQLLCIAIAAVIYTPFVLAANHQKPVEEEE
ncbi:MAG: PTS sugar transporter subunit IIC [Hungatella sp.]|nr:PTS sugar transporter subunit IIC [Hungatella sp.]